MTAATFNQLNTADQIRTALRHDTLIGERSEGPRSMHLYAVEQFYVEVIFTTRKKNVLVVHASETDDILEPYLRRIDLSELL